MNKRLKFLSIVVPLAILTIAISAIYIQSYNASQLVANANTTENEIHEGYPLIAINNTSTLPKSYQTYTFVKVNEKTFFDYMGYLQTILEYNSSSISYNLFRIKITFYVYIGIYTYMHTNFSAIYAQYTP